MTELSEKLTVRVDSDMAHALSELEKERAATTSEIVRDLIADELDRVFGSGDVVTVPVELHRDDYDKLCKLETISRQSKEETIQQYIKNGLNMHASQALSLRRSFWLSHPEHRDTRGPRSLRTRFYAWLRRGRK